MSNTPENQRQEMEMILKRFAAWNDSCKFGPYRKNAPVVLSPLYPKENDQILEYIRSLQSTLDTVMREHGELRKEVLANAMEDCVCASGECFTCTAGLLIERIPDRSVPPQA